MSRKIKQYRVPLDIPESFEQRLRDNAAKAGLSLDDYLCKTLAEQLKRYDEGPGLWICATVRSLSENMSLRLDDVEFECVEFDLPEALEQKLRYLAAKAGVSLNLFLASLLSQAVARDDGEFVGDYRYSGQP
jgi:predicted HicB family RNase H-like nuclease